MEKKWRRIGKGEMLPTSSIIRPIDGGLPNIAGSCVMVGQDCYYISVDDAYELLKGLPLETEAEAKERNEATIIKKLIGIVKETEFLSEENRASLLDWIEKQGKQKPAWSEEDEIKLGESISLIRSNNTGTFYYEKNELISFLKDLKDRVQPQTTWKPSEEQMAELRRVISGCSYDIEPLAEMEEQLKHRNEKAYYDVKKLLEG